MLYIIEILNNNLTLITLIDRRHLSSQEILLHAKKFYIIGIKCNAFISMLVHVLPKQVYKQSKWKKLIKSRRF